MGREDEWQNGVDCRYKLVRVDDTAGDNLLLVTSSLTLEYTSAGYWDRSLQVKRRILTGCFVLSESVYHSYYELAIKV